MIYWAGLTNKVRPALAIIFKSGIISYVIIKKFKILIYIKLLKNFNLPKGVSNESNQKIYSS